jgi:dienelactone hydrolase
MNLQSSVSLVALVFLGVSSPACGSDPGSQGSGPGAPFGVGATGSGVGGVFAGAGGGGATGVGGGFVGAGGGFVGAGGGFVGAGGGFVGAGGGFVGAGGGFVGAGGGFVGAGGQVGAGGGFVGAGGQLGAGGQVGNGTCCPGCYCRGPAPTEQSATAPGPYQTQNYTSGFRDGPDFLAGTIYYPTGGDAVPPYAAVVICPGWTAVQASIAGWGPFLSSHGIVTMTIDTNTTGDSVVQRAAALLDALTSLKAENTRAGSPLQGKLSPDRYGLMGWSMGGGGTWIDAAKHPELKSAISLAGHDATAGGPSIATGTTVPSFMFCGAQDTPILGGGGQSQGVYNIIPATTPKILYEMANEGHFSWGTPTTTNSGALGRYGLAFQKVFLEGDERYRFLLLVPGPLNSAWMSNVQ